MYWYQNGPINMLVIITMNYDSKRRANNFFILEFIKLNLNVASSV